MSITLQQIAEKTGVSIATVSHAINKTRYVSPELVRKIYKTAEENGYLKKDGKAVLNSVDKSGKQSEIALLIPNLNSAAYSQMITDIESKVRERGYLLSIFITGGEYERERHVLTELMSDRRTAGIILFPVQERGKIYKKLIKSEVPFVCLEKVMDLQGMPEILSDYRQGAELAVKHLIKNGHEKIMLFMEREPAYISERKKEGYQSAYKEMGEKYKKEWMVALRATEESVEQIRELIKKNKPTALIAAGDIATSNCLKAFQSMGMEYPKDISLVVFGEDEWNMSGKLPVTTLQQNTGKMAEEAVISLLSWLGTGKLERYPIKKVPMYLSIRKSTQLLAKGPNGESVLRPENILLSKEEEELVRQGNYKVAISLHYTGTEWTRLHEKAIRNSLENLGVRVMSVMDAHFDYKIQNMQLESLLSQNPDAVIAVPTDEEHTAAVFRKLSKKTKLIFINGLPKGFKEKDYSFWVSVNELENGGNAAKIMGSFFGGRKEKVGLLIHGASFFATKQRDFFTEELLRRHYSNIQIAAKEKFEKEENIDKVCMKMLRQHPDIKGIYVTWDRPALRVLKLLKELNRTDIAVVTTDLDYEVASYIAGNEMVIGLSSQRPYEQGEAVAAATARALIEKAAHGCVGVPPYMVLPKNLEKSWNEILKSKLPQF